MALVAELLADWSRLDSIGRFRAAATQAKARFFKQEKSGAIPTKKGVPMCNDLAIYELNPAERLLVISFRLWALPHAQPERIHPDWRVGFRSSGLDGVACNLFDPLLATLFSASCRPIEVHRAMCVGVSRDEEEFLWCVGLHQNDRRDEAAEILANWLPPAAARVATSLIGNLAESLRVAGLLLLTHQFEHLPSRQLSGGIGRGRHLVH